YIAVLAKGVASPIAKESDEEGAKKGDDAKDEKKDAKTDEKKDAKTDDKKAPVSVAVDPDGLSQRIVAIQLPSAYYSNLQVAKTGELYYLKSAAGEQADFDSSLAHYSLTKRKEDSLLDKVDDFEISRDGKRVLLKMKDSWSISDVGDKID